ncbi:MAG: hypothetical protein KJN60_09025 [Boseongicola sp.]|nr:hypothetical protein [Boseongicola sp.]
MQPIVMTEMLRATTTFNPDGRPVDPERKHRLAFSDQKNQKGQSGTYRKIWCALRARLLQITAALHFGYRTQDDVS